MDPRFICLEGIDGSGSTTAAKLLTKRLNEKGVDALYTKEPSDGAIGRHIRRILKGEDNVDEMGMFPMFLADRWDHICNVVKPELEQGNWVICDRYTASTWVYQQDNYTTTEIENMTAPLPVPDWLFVLEAPVEVCQKRLEARGGVKERYDSNELQQKYFSRYREAVSLAMFGGQREVLDTESFTADQIVSIILDKVIDG